MADGMGFERALVERRDVEAERAVLGAILFDDRGELAVLARVRSIVKPEDFSDPGLGVIFEAMERCDRGAGLTLNMVLSELRAMDRLQTVGGTGALNDLVDYASTTAHVEQHAQIIADHAIAREAARHAWRLEQLASRPGTTTAEIVAGAQRILDIAAGRGLAADDGTLDAAVEAEDERVFADHDTTVRATGIGPIDTVLAGGLRGGELIIPGGRPSSGKSALCFQIALVMALAGWPVVIFSLEMQRRDVLQRLAAMLSGIDLARIRSRAFEPGEVELYRATTKRVLALPLRIFDTAGMSPMDIRARCLATRARMGSALGLVVVDYLQKCSPGTRCDNREQEVAVVARALKNLAKELDAPVLAPAQLNRGVEGDDRPPTMADYRSSGEIEQEADILLGIHRPKSAMDTREVYVIKQRNGPTGQRIDLAFVPQTAQFVPSMGDAA